MCTRADESETTKRVHSLNLSLMESVVNVVLMLPLAVAAVALTAGAVFYVSESERLTRAVGAFGALLALFVLLSATGCASTQHCPQAYGYDTFTSRPVNPW